MKITIIKNIATAKKSTANWSYRVHAIIDRKGYRMYRETFGGDSRLIRKLQAEGHNVDVLTNNIEPAAHGVRQVEKMPDIEDYQAGENF